MLKTEHEQDETKRTYRMVRRIRLQHQGKMGKIKSKERIKMRRKNKINKGKADNRWINAEAKKK